MSLELQDLIVESPVSLIYWKLGASFRNIQEVLSRETEVRELKDIEDLLTWLHHTEVKNLIVALPDPEEFKTFNRFLEKITPEKRRELFIIFISPHFKTLDPLLSFLYGVNLIIKEEDLSEFERIFSKARAYWMSLYSPFFKTFSKLTEGEI